ncbi:MAG: glycosyltransferase [Synergistaceae bacterium]|jgi:glycosyltransferase involved in cell wall biosynthesis|nr:glycosyltransferase [Synergistaceae bacterium]
MNGQPGILIATTIPETLRAFLVPYACYFRGLGWRVDAIAKGAAKCDDLAIHFDRLIDAEWTRNPFDFSSLSAGRMIRETVAAGGYDIVHVHTPVASFVTRWALRDLKKSGKPAVVYTAHGFHFYKGGARWSNLLYRRLERLAGRWTDRLIVINREDCEAAGKYSIVPADRIAYMPGIGLDFSRYDPETVSREDVQQIRGRLGLKNDDILFTVIGEFNPAKRQSDVIHAMSKLPAGISAHAAFAGEGPLKDRMTALSDSLGLSKKIHFMGFFKHIPHLILASRAVLVPSEREGLSRTAMESACLGVPIIGSDARGVRDVVQQGRGLLYPTGDVLALRDAMQQLCEEPHPPVAPDPEWRIEHLLRLHRKLYEELMGTQRTGE